MAICHFCTEEFGSEQGVKAHMKKCEFYQADKRKKAAALGKLPKAAVTSAPVQPNPPVEAPDFTAPLRDLVKSMCEATTKPDVPQTPQQQRRTILQAAKERVIDRYRAPSGQVTDSLRGSAKLAIERKLASLPLEELPFEEVCELAAAIRDGLYTTAFKRQAREAELQRVERENRHQDELEALGALLRADRRKKIFLQQANQQAHARCESKGIRGWDHLAVLSDVGRSLEEFLTGSESVLDAYTVMQKVVDTRLLEAEATLDTARAKADEQWRDEVAAVLVLGAVAGLVVLSLNYPAQTVAIFEWVERTFGYTPGAEAAAPTPESSAQTPPTASTESRPPSKRRRKYPDAPSSPESPWANSVGGEPAHA